MKRKSHQLKSNPSPPEKIYGSVTTGEFSYENHLKSQKRIIEQDRKRYIPNPDALESGESLARKQGFPSENIGFENWPEILKRGYKEALKRSRELNKRIRLEELALFFQLGDMDTLGTLIVEQPKEAAKIFKPNLLENVIVGVNSDSHEELIEAWRAMLPGLADPKKRGIWLANLYSLINTIRVKKSANIIGRCENETCKKFFLRVRKDQKCCSKTCNGAVRTRKWRENYKEKYQHRRYQRAESAKGGK
jgi:hypothetical protein